jgi:hypothetical protein
MRSGLEAESQSQRSGIRAPGSPAPRKPASLDSPAQIRDSIGQEGRSTPIPAVRDGIGHAWNIILNAEQYGDLIADLKRILAEADNCATTPMWQRNLPPNIVALLRDAGVKVKKAHDLLSKAEHDRHLILPGLRLTRTPWINSVSAGRTVTPTAGLGAQACCLLPSRSGAIARPATACFGQA